jgi:hypothetical protein
MIPDLSTKPSVIEACGMDAVAAINEIKSRGGHVFGMAQVNGQNGRWRLSIHWPQPGQGELMIPTRKAA